MFLESQQIIDYSLLLGLHFRAPEQLNALLKPPDALLKHQSSHETDGRYPFLCVDLLLGVVLIYFLSVVVHMCSQYLSLDNILKIVAH